MDKEVVSGRELVPVERRLTAERTKKVFMMRKSQAQIESNLTEAMFDAWMEIERAFKLISGALGYGIADPNHVPGKTEPDQEWAADQIKKYREWARSCEDKYKGVVIDMTVFSFSPDEVAFQRGIDKKTVMTRFRQGLNAYCVIQGWGDQINKQ